MGKDEVRLEAAAGRLQRMLRALKDGARLHVRPGTGHLTIEREDTDGARLVVARAQPGEERTWRLLVLEAPGQWQATATQGPLEEVADGLLELLYPKFERANFAVRPREAPGRVPTWSPSEA